MISGQPKLILRLEGLVLFAAGLAAFLYLKQSVWIFAGLFLVPDLSMAAYLAGPKPGAIVYNIFHTTLGRCFWLSMACCLVNCLRRFSPVSGLPISGLIALLATA
jgi:hypothetical protein